MNTQYFRRNFSLINHGWRCLINPDKLLPTFYIILQQVEVLGLSPSSIWTLVVTTSSTVWKMLLKVKSERVLQRRSGRTERSASILSMRSENDWCSVNYLARFSPCDLFVEFIKDCLFINVKLKYSSTSPSDLYFSTVNVLVIFRHSISVCNRKHCCDGHRFNRSIIIKHCFLKLRILKQQNSFNNLLNVWTEVSAAGSDRKEGNNLKKSQNQTWSLVFSVVDTVWERVISSVLMQSFLVMVVSVSRQPH